MRAGLENLHGPGEAIGRDADESRRDVPEAVPGLAPQEDGGEHREEEKEGAACGSPGEARRHPRNARERVAEGPGPLRCVATGLLGLGGGVEIDAFHVAASLSVRTPRTWDERSSKAVPGKQGVPRLFMLRFGESDLKTE